MATVLVANILICSIVFADIVTAANEKYVNINTEFPKIYVDSLLLIEGSKSAYFTKARMWKSAYKRLCLCS